MKKVVFKINIFICVYLYSFYFSSIVFYLILRVLYANQTIIKLGFFLVTVHATVSYFQYNL